MENLVNGKGTDMLSLFEADDYLLIGGRRVGNLDVSDTTKRGAKGLGVFDENQDGVIESAKLVAAYILTEEQREQKFTVANGVQVVAIND